MFQRILRKSYFKFRNDAYLIGNRILSKKVHDQQSNKGIGTRYLEKRTLDVFEGIGYECKKRDFGDNMLWAVITSTKPLTNETFQNSLQMMVKQQPLLQAKVVDDGKNLYFECEEGVAPVIEIEYFNESGTKVEEVSEEILSREPGDPQYFKAYRFNEEYDRKKEVFTNTVGLRTSHLVADGKGIVQLLKQLLRFMNEIENGEEKDIKCFSMQPSSANLVKNYIGWSTWQKILLLPQIYGCFIRVVMRAQSSRTFVHPVLSAIKSTYRNESDIKPGCMAIRHFIAATDASRLVEKCRKEQCAITGAFISACHFAFCLLVPEEANIRSDSKIDLNIPVSIQKYCANLPDEYIGNFISSISYDIPYTRDVKKFWELARYYSKAIGSDIEMGKHWQTLKLSEILGRKVMVEEMNKEQILGERRVSGHNVSNIGSFYFPKQNNDIFSLVNAWAVPQFRGRIGTFVNHILTINGNINWVMSFEKSLIPEDVAKKYSKISWQIINDFGLKDSYM